MPDYIVTLEQNVKAQTTAVINADDADHACEVARESLDDPDFADSLTWEILDPGEGWLEVVGAEAAEEA